MAETNNRFRRFWEWQKRHGEERPIFWGWIMGTLLAILSYVVYVVGGDGDPYISVLFASAAGLAYGRYSVYLLRKQKAKRRKSGIE